MSTTHQWRCTCLEPGLRENSDWPFLPGVVAVIFACCCMLFRVVACCCCTYARTSTQTTIYTHSHTQILSHTHTNTFSQPYLDVTVLQGFNNDGEEASGGGVGGQYVLKGVAVVQHPGQLFHHLSPHRTLCSGGGVEHHIGGGAMIKTFKGDMQQQHTKKIQK